MLLLRQAQQARPNERSVSEIEGMQELVLDQFVCGDFFSGFWQFPQIIEYHWDI